MLFQPSNISPSEINNTGTVDFTKGLTVSWRVNGDSPMIAYQIVFYENTPSSKQVYDTGKIALESPFWGTSYSGKIKFFSADFSAETITAAGLSNGNEYKFLITQWWTENDSIQQSTATVIMGRSEPQIELSPISSPLTEYAYSFTGDYSQAQGDTLRWVQWQIAEKNSSGIIQAPFLDTGRIYGTGELKVDYSGFLNDSDYAIQLIIETSSGITASTGWVSFSVQYSVSEATGQVNACQTINGDVLITWEQIPATKGYDIYRLTKGENFLEKIASVDNTVGEMRDWSACSGETYTYYVFPTGPFAYLSAPVISNPVSVKFWHWNIIEASLNDDGTYTTLESYYFRYGFGGVQEGNFSNNNSPQIQKNFTKYPTRQPETSNYLTGSVSGFVGTVNSLKVYKDTLAQARSLRNLSVSTNTLFLRDPEGHFLMIHTAQPITVSINHGSTVMPHTVSISWVEVGDAEGIKIISTPESSFWPTDNIVFTSLKLDPYTGELVWTRDDDYNSGSVLSIVNGQLVQTTGPGYTPAKLEIVDGNILEAELLTDTGG